MTTGDERGAYYPNRYTAIHQKGYGSMAVSEWSNLALRGACLAKLPGVALKTLLRDVAPPSDVWQDVVVVPSAEIILTSVDFGPLVWPDPHTAGRIAVLNACSDIYAAGGTPTTALAILVIDTARSIKVAHDVMAGIAATCILEGMRLAGGHTSIGSDYMAGLSVIGRADRDGLLRKDGAKSGDELFLSKPLGIGLVLWGRALGVIDDAVVTDALDVMLTSNGAASRAAVAAGVHASTDVTGFGLLGHLSEMLGAEYGAVLDIDKIPILRGVDALPSESRTTAAVGANAAYVAGAIALHSSRTADDLAVLFDAQTNGGLLVAAAPASRAMLEQHHFICIGRINSDRRIVVE
jgi:selenide,water dikinase